MDMVNKILSYEDGEMDEQEIIDLFQELIDTGVSWKLQGRYGRMENNIIESGHCQG